MHPGTVPWPRRDAYALKSIGRSFDEYAGASSIWVSNQRQNHSPVPAGCELLSRNRPPAIAWPVCWPAGRKLPAQAWVPSKTVSTAICGLTSPWLKPGGSTVSILRPRRIIFFQNRGLTVPGANSSAIITTPTCCPLPRPSVRLATFPASGQHVRDALEKGLAYLKAFCRRTAEFTRPGRPGC